MRPDPFNEFRPDVFLRWGALISAMTRVYFRYRLRSTHLLPSGPCILVGNHSGLGTAELLCLMGAWSREMGIDRRCTGLAHDITLRIPLAGRFYRAMGGVPASQENARRALGMGHDVIVFPGGDLDACRPFYQPRRVFFGKRRGYAKLALAAGVPIVPLATIGSHYTWLFAPGGIGLAHLIGANRWARNDRVPIPVGLFVVIAAVVAMTAHLTPPIAVFALIVAVVLPTPVRITSELLPPIDLARETAGIEDPVQRLERGNAIVLEALEAAVTNMRHDRPLRRPSGSAVPAPRNADL